MIEVFEAIVKHSAFLCCLRHFSVAPDPGPIQGEGPQRLNLKK